jgi:sigma-E factor negative regulatory protein RseA
MVMDKISAFMDGESEPTESHQTLNRLRNDPECREVWNSFHLVGDVMRGDPVLCEDFLTKLRQRMDGEPTVLAPHARWGGNAKFAYSAAAAAAGIAVVLTLVMTNNPLRPQGELATAPKTEAVQIAQTTPTDTRAQPAPAADLAHVNEYLMAHQEFSPRTALQGVVPYVRSVSASHDGSRR